MAGHLFIVFMDYFENTLVTLRDHAERIATRSHAPYSGRKEGVVIMLEDGALVAGARVENA